MVLPAKYLGLFIFAYVITLSITFRITADRDVFNPYFLCFGAVTTATQIALYRLVTGPLFPGFLCALCVLCGEQSASAIECPDPKLSFDVPAEIRKFFANPDGSCVQCSIGMCGVSQNVPNAATLLWNTEYGPKERGGSGPSRVANYARKRGLRIYNITGKQTYDWLRWAYRNGRPAAIGAAPVHFQTGCGCHPKEGDATWYVCDNNKTNLIAEYSQKGFERLHESSGTWIVILDYPPVPPRPKLVAWWQ